MSEAPQITLAIESAIAGGSVSLVSTGREVAAWKGTAGLSRAEDLLPVIDRLFAEIGVEKRDVRLVAVSAGPGSFTGIRIGISTGMGIVDGLAVPMSSANILEVMANVVNDHSLITAVIPMGRFAICFQTFERSSSRLAPRTEPVTLPEQDLAAFTRSHPEHKFVCQKEFNYLVQGSAHHLVLETALATLLGQWCEARPPFVVSPLFVAKSF